MKIVLNWKPLSAQNDVGRNPSSGYKFVGPGHPSCRTHGMPIAYDSRIRLIIGHTEWRPNRGVQNIVNYTNYLSFTLVAKENKLTCIAH